MKSPLRLFTRRSFIPMSLVLVGGPCLLWKHRFTNRASAADSAPDAAALDEMRRRAEALAHREAEVLQRLTSQVNTAMCGAGEADQESLRLVRNALKTELSTLRAEARGKIQTIGKVMSGFGECARMVLLMAKDQVTGSHSAAEQVAMRTAGVRESLLRLQAAGSSAMTSLEREIGTHSNQLSAQVLGHVQEICGSGEEDLQALAKRIGSMTSDIQIEQAGLGISLALIPLDVLAVVDLTLRVMRQVLDRYVKRAATTAGANVALAASDGPLPFGEALAILLDVGFAVWTAWDLYHHCKHIRPAIEGRLREAVDEAQAGIMAAFDQQAAAWLRDAGEKRSKALQPLLAAANPNPRLQTK